MSEMLHRLSPPPLPRRTKVAAMLAAMAPEAARRADELACVYSLDLAGWGRVCRPEELQESLYVLDLFDRHVRPYDPAGPGLDVGSKNWAYLPALAAAVPGEWTGVELAAHRRYLTLVTRAAVAQRRCSAIGNATYVAASVTDVSGTYGLVTWFLPFVRIEPLRRWGLADDAYDPPGLLAHVWAQVAPGGLLWVSNQGAGEASLQEGLFRSAGIDAIALGPMTSELSPFRLTRTGWLARKGARQRVRDFSGE